MLDILTQNDIFVLKNIIDKNDKTKGRVKTNGTTVKEIQIKTNLSDRKIRNSIQMFLDKGCVVYGISNGKSKTYCITSSGIEILLNINKDVIELEGLQEEEDCE